MVPQFGVGRVVRTGTLVTAGTAGWDPHAMPSVAWVCGCG
jgi:hypothetical protein